MVTIKTSDFNKMVKRLAVATTGKVPVLFMQAKDGRLMGQASDGVCSVSSVIAAKCEEEDFSCFVDYKLIANVMGQFEKMGDEDISFQTTGALTILSGSGKVDLPLLTKKDYTDFVPPKGASVMEATLDGMWLKKALNAGLKSVSMDEKMTDVIKTVFLRFSSDQFESGGTDGHLFTLLSQGVYKVPPKDLRNIVDVGIFSARVKPLIASLEEEDTVIRVYETCIALKNGTSAFMIPITRTSWEMHDKMVQMANEVAESGSSFEIRKKELLSALELVSSNVKVQDDLKVYLTIKGESIQVVNGSRTASINLPIEVAKDAPEIPVGTFAISLLKQAVSSLNGENIAMTLASFEPSMAHFEELTEQTVLLGINSK